MLARLWRLILRAWPYGGGIAVLVLTMMTAKTIYDRKQREIGRLQEQARHWQAEVRTVRDSLTVLARTKAKIDTQYIADTTGMARREQVWREAYSALRYRLDLGPDSVLVPIEVVREVIVQADTLLRQCLAAVRTGEQRVSVCDAMQERQRAEIALLKARPLPKPRRFIETWGERALCLGVGYSAGRWLPR